MAGRRLFQSEELEAEELKLMVDKLPAAEQEVAFSRAQQAWVRVGYGSARASGKARPTVRADKGAKRRRRTDVMTEVGFLEKRRRIIDAAVVASPVSSTALLSVPRDHATWAAGHDKEFTFLLEKRFDRLVDAVLNGSQAPEKLSLEMLDIVVREVRRRKHESDAQGRKRQRQVDIAALKSPTFDNAKYFIDPDIMRMPDIDRLVGELRVAYPRSVHAQDRWEGDMLIAKDPVHLGMFNSWAVGLRGIAVVDLRYACTNGTSGICISYNKYASRRRVLHQTPAFVDKYPLLSVVIQRCTPEWQHVDADRLSEIKHRFVGRSSRAAELLVFCTSEEYFAHRAPLYAGIKFFFTEKIGRAAVSTVAKSASRLDVCDY